MQRRDLLLTMSLGLAGWFRRPVEAKVARTDLPSLVLEADLILIAKVQEVLTDGGVTLARAVPKPALKGIAPERIFFVAQPTWTCDMSNAVPGETVLLFLDKATSLQFGFKGQPERKGVVKSRPLYQISHSGRGRMVIETVQGKPGATLYAHDVDVPNSVPRLKEERTGSYLSWATVSLEALEKAIQREIEAQKRLSVR